MYAKRAVWGKRVPGFADIESSKTVLLNSQQYMITMTYILACTMRELLMRVLQPIQMKQTIEYQ